MRKYLVLGSALFVSLVSLGARGAGGCETYGIPLTQELRDWELGPTSLETNQGSAGTLLPLSKRLRLMLQKLPAKPGQANPGFGGIVPLRVANTGTYKISVGAPVDIEMREAKGSAVAETAREQNTACDKMKTVTTYPLKGGLDYVLKLDQVGGNSIELMLSR